MGKRRPTKRAAGGAAAQGPKRAWLGSLSPVDDGFLPAATDLVVDVSGIQDVEVYHFLVVHVS